VDYSGESPFWLSGLCIPRPASREV
jgi:hypothetical protein